MREIIAVDVGGTNARFCRATVQPGVGPVLGEVRKYKVGDFASLADCWEAFRQADGLNLPCQASIAFAAPVKGEQIKLTNSSWLIRPESLARELGLDDLVLVNDFEAVGHAISCLPIASMELLFGPDIPFPANGAVTVVGPGTGLGACILVFRNGAPHVIATEAGHLDFAPLDTIEAQLLEQLRAQFMRVSTERIVSGPGLNNIYRGLATIEHAKVELMKDADLWQAALDGSNPLARQALGRLCMCYGAVVGNLALAHGPSAVVLAGDLTQRMKPVLKVSGFHARFTAKGRYENLMHTIPVRLARHHEIGLYGAAAAFVAEFL